MEISKRIRPVAFWLVLATTFNHLLFWAIIPLWHGPDEQAHFAQVQYLAEHKHSFPPGVNFTTSEEVVISERLLGTERNEFGKNRFTHNPGYRIPYSNDTYGIDETSINNLPKAMRTNLIKTEATYYPPLFYIISSFFYLLANPFGLITRVFVTRLASVLMGTALSLFVYKLAQLLYPKDMLKTVTITLLVSLHPMQSFLTATVNSDNLMNLLFTAFLYLCCKIIVTQKFSPSHVIALISISIAGFLTKPHFAIILPILLLLPMFIKLNPKKLFFLATGFFILAGLRLNRQIIDVAQGGDFAFSDVGLFYLFNPQKNISLLTHLGWTMRHTIAEVIPWYWGVFNWLGVVLPRIVNRIINRILIIASIGALVWIWKRRFQKKLHPRDHAIIFLGLSTVVFFAVLLAWDWLYIRGKGFSFGMQGRYYFPTISAHMIWLLAGITSLIPSRWKSFLPAVTKLLGMSMIVLNAVALYTVTAAYYNLTSISIFFNQISQYKPLLVKYPWLILWIATYVISTVKFIYHYLIYAESHSRSRN